MANPRLDTARAAAFARQSREVRARVQSFAARQFAAGQYRDADLARFVSQVSPVVLASRRQVSSMTDAYLTQVLQSSGIKPPRRGPIDTATLRGVPVDEVYARPYQSVWTSLSNDVAYPDAVATGASRLVDLIATDMQLAMTHTSRDVLTHSRGVTGYSRSPSGVNTCALCEIASTQVYYKADLMPIHPNCGCGVDIISESKPWDQSAADQRLYDTHAAVQDALGMDDPSARAPDYRKLIVTREHGEIGPMLARASDRFTGPDALKAA